MRRLPPLSALPAFEAVARLGSVTAAAKELGRTHGAISKQLKHLSEDLGAPLFERDGVGLQLTPDGEALRAVATPILDRLEAACDAIRPDGRPDHFRLGVSATFAMRWLTPRLPKFYARHPSVEIEIKIAGKTRLRDGGVDVGLTIDRLSHAFTPSAPGRSRSDAEQGPIRMSLGEIGYGIVCAPDYQVERVGDEIRAPARINVSSSPRAWEGWLALMEMTMRFDREDAYPHHFLALEAAAAGMGVMVSGSRLVDKDLAEGRLIAPFGFKRVPGGFGAYVARRSARRPIVRAFLSWLEAELRADQPEDA